MLGYAMMLGLKRTLGMQTFLEPQVLSNLDHFFENIQGIPSLERICEDDLNYPWETFMMGVPQLNTTEMRAGCALEIPMKVC